MAAGGGEFGGAGKKAGMLIWRVENRKGAFGVAPWPVKEYGNFYSGDSYLVLKTYESDSSLKHDLHFWLGKDTTQDEYGTAAIKAAELDAALGGAPVQHREVQDHESSLFTSYFKTGITYMDGGMESGFRSASAAAEQPPRLFHLKGSRTVRASQVAVERASLNDGDVFVLSTKNVIFQFNGSGSSKTERAKALELTVRLRDHDGGEAHVAIIDANNSQNTSQEHIAQFWQLLGGQGSIKSAEEGGDDEVHEAAARGTTLLYRVSDSSGNLHVEQIASAPLSRSMLDSNDAFIVDTGNEVFVWVGKNATKDERKKSMEHAAQFVRDSGRPDWTPITRQVERGETPMFKEKFADWLAEEQRTNMQASAAAAGSRSNVARPQASKVNASAMHAREQAEDAMVDDATGRLEVWRVEDFAPVVVNATLHGHFYQGDCYIVRYTYNGGSEQLIYFWQGRDSTNDERGASALLAKKFDDDFGGQAVQVRVVQGKEPNHFRALFHGRMIIHLGGVASGFNNVNAVDQYDTDGTRLFQVRGTNAKNVVAAQVPEQAASLNTNDCFVLETPTKKFIWIGNGSSADERRYAGSIAGVLCNKAATSINEGSEPAEFWDALGGQGEYANFAHLASVEVQPRLFWVSNASGRVVVEEVCNFAQDDLLNDDVFILDTFNEIYVWIGSGANEEEQKQGATVAVEYVDTATDGRDKDCSITMIHAGHEPIMFTCHFQAWSAELATKNAAGGSFEDKFAAVNRPGVGRVVQSKGAAGATKSAPTPVNARAVAAASASGASAAPITTFYPYAALMAKPAPDGVDTARLEEYLSDADFAGVFGMDKAKYRAQPGWRKTEQKKKHHLF